MISLSTNNFDVCSPGISSLDLSVASLGISAHSMHTVLYADRSYNYYDPCYLLASVQAQTDSSTIRSHADIPKVAKLGKRKASVEHLGPDKKFMTVSISVLIF